MWRAVLLLSLGLVLQDLDHGAAVILQDYAALFVVAAVVLASPGRWLLGLVGLVLPIGSVGFLQGRLVAPEVFDRGVVAISDPATEIVHGLLLSGPYPLITWLAPFLFIADAFPRATRPLVVTGQLALTVYVGHLLVLHSAPDASTADEVIPAIGILGVFALASLVVSSLWRRRFRQGPLELLLHLPWRRN